MPSLSFIGDEPLSTDSSGTKRSSSAKLPSGLSINSPKGTSSKQPKRLPLNDVSNTTTIPGTTVKTCSPYTPKKQHLLNQVKLQWRIGKYCKQSEVCRNALRACLQNDTTQDEIARYVVGNLFMHDDEVQRIEFKRVKDCSRCIKKTLQKEQEAVVGATKRANDYEVVHSIHFLRNGSVYQNVCDLKERNNMSVHAERVTQMDIKIAPSALTDQTSVMNELMEQSSLEPSMQSTQVVEGQWI